MLRTILLQTTKLSLGTVTRTGLQTNRSLFSLASNGTRVANQTIFASSTQCSNTLIFKRYKRLNFKKLKRLAAEVEEKEKVPEVKMNEDLSAFEKFLLIGKDKKPLGVVAYHDAYAMAKRDGLDLVLVQANANPPVAKLLAPTDKKLQKIKASKNVGIKERIKEVQFSEVITEHDMQTKITKLRSMLKRQYRVRVRIQFKDRKNFDQELAREIMLNVAARVKDLALRDSRTGFKVESSAVYSLLVPRSLLPEDATDDDETKETPKAKKEKAPNTVNQTKTADSAKTATASAATEALKSKPHPAEAVQEEDIEEDLAAELEEEEGEEGEGDGLADLAPEEIEELLAQIEREEKQKKQKEPPAVVAKGEPTKNAATSKGKDNNKDSNTSNKGKDTNANNKGKDNNANKQTDNRQSQRENKNQNRNNNENKTNNKRNR